MTKLRDAALPSAEQAEQAAKRAHDEIAKRLKAESDELANAKPAKQALDDRVAQLNQAELPKAQKRGRPTCSVSSTSCRTRSPGTAPSSCSKRPRRALWTRRCDP